jgi:hypothetical protein
VVVELLLLLWSRKELDLGHSNCACDTDDEEDIAASQKPLEISHSSQSKSIPSRPKCNSLWSVRSRPKCNLSPITTTEHFVVEQLNVISPLATAP